MSRRSLVLAGLVTVLLAGAVALAVAAQRKPSASAKLTGSPAASASGGLPVLWQVPSFSFSDQNGRTTTTKDLRDHVFIADFIFTSCTSICPLITAKMALLQRRLANSKLRFVSFSVDPEHDDPKTLKRYASEWRPGESRWLLFATTPSTLKSLADAMYVAVEPAKNDIAHTNLFFLVDQRGAVRGIYESDKNDAIERLVKDAEELSGVDPSDSPPQRKPATGAELYALLGCGACHARADSAPPLEGLVGRRIALDGGVELTADAAYVRESITAPSAKLVSGYALAMPSYADELTPGELDLLVEHVATLTAAPVASATEKPTAPAPSTRNAPLASSPAAPVTPEPAAVVVDPVCSMNVRVADSTPRASHAGHTYYFCSEMCRDRFVAEPARYAKPAVRTP